MMANCRTRFRIAAFGLAFGLPAVAHAGGYDTPMLYSARHMGMGGTAIGYVNDPSSLFHNPAGLAHIVRGEIMGDVSLLVGGIHASPSAVGTDVDSETTVAPFFLIGGAYRLHKMITLGVAVYPIASAGATFKYGAGSYEDHTQLLFLEASPGIAFNPLPNLRFGAGYRVTYVHLARFQGDRDPGGMVNHDFKVSGQNFTGFRLGAQWDVLPWLHVGALFRNTVNTKVTNSNGIALTTEYTDISTHFKLPAKLGVGTRVDFDQFNFPGSAAVDFEYDFNSQNKGDALEGTPALGSGGVPSVSNVFEWRDSQTLRLGGEYRIWHDARTHLDRVPLRVGYVYDTRTANPRYPTAFGTPPGATHVFTAGTGYNAGTWQANLAYAYRFGHGAVTDPDTNNCAFCSVAGNDDYRIHLSGIYLDASYKF